MCWLQPNRLPWSRVAGHSQIQLAGKVDQT